MQILRSDPDLRSLLRRPASAFAGRRGLPRTRPRQSAAWRPRSSCRTRPASGTAWPTTRASGSSLYFYPKDDTPGCTTQACGFRDNVFAFNKEGAVILGISVDDVAVHKAFAEKHGLPFTLLADSDKAVTKEYGVLKTYMGVMEMARRDTFIIDPQGRVAKHYETVDPEGHSQVVLEDLKALKAAQAKG